MARRPTPRRIAIVTVARSDYGIYRPLLREIEADPDLELQLIASAGHLAPDQGNSLEEILGDGFRPVRLVDCALSSDRPGAMARAMGLATIGFVQAYETLAPDLLVVLGDRFEMHAATVAAVPLMIPIAHIAGGSVTRGALDDAFRHSITKLSHLHFTECEAHRARLEKLGESDWRIHVTGSLAIDNLANIELMSLAELNSRFGLALEQPPLLVTLHSVTREYAQTRAQTAALLAALERQPAPVVLTQPNVDPGGRLIAELFQSFVHEHPDRAFLVPHLGTRGYFSMMANALAMVGNSSSGIFESASFALPVVNVGRRQEGRRQPENVLQCDPESDAIADALATAVSPRFRESLTGMVNPYGDGHAAGRMIEVLRQVPLDQRLLVKEAF
jgi:UDP-hydrolysing UDP-N-acetyl-D-glucosamine 2-epimerase